MDLNRKEVKRKTKEFLIKLPIPPSVNKIHYTDKRGVRRLTGASEKYIQDVRAVTRMFIEDTQFEKFENGTWLYMDLVFYFPDKRIRDSHNCLKILLDALEGLLFMNDYYVMPRIQSVELDKENPHVVLKVFEQTKRERTNHRQDLCDVVL